MSFRSFILLCTVAFVASFMPAAAIAQFGNSAYLAGANGPSGTINTSGSVTIKVKPDRLRMYVQVTGKGKTLKDALANLKKHHDEAVPRFEALGAKKDSILMGPPSAAGQTQSDKMNMMIRAHMGRSKPEKKGPKVYQVNAELTAVWPLTTDKPEALLLFVDNLTEQIGKIDLAGKKDAKKLSLEEQELLEEMEGTVEVYSSSNDDEVKPGQPHFRYIGTVTDEQIDNAMRDAFKLAKASAKRLAKAADVKLGPLRGLSGDNTSIGDGFDDFGGSYELRRYFQQATHGLDIKASKNEAIASKPGPIQYEVSVATLFGIKNK